MTNVDFQAIFSFDENGGMISLCSAEETFELSVSLAVEKQLALPKSNQEKNSAEGGLYFYFFSP